MYASMVDQATPTYPRPYPETLGGNIKVSCLCIPKDCVWEQYTSLKLLQWQRPLLYLHVMPPNRQHN